MADRLPNFEEMTLDELDAWKVNKKKQIRDLQEEYDAANKYRKDKVLEQHVQAAIDAIETAAELHDRSAEEQAMHWLTEENADDAGHRVQATLYLRHVGRIN